MEKTARHSSSWMLADGRIHPPPFGMWEKNTKTGALNSITRRSTNIGKVALQGQQPLGALTIAILWFIVKNNRE